MKRIFLTSLAFLLIFVSFPISGGVLAQDEDEAALENELLLKIPDETDNPNYNITFKDPSDTGVFISIDGGKEKEIKSPYQLPSLGIGRHALSFKYTTEDEKESTYEAEIVVVPRPPEINPPSHEGNKLIINGKAVAASTLYLFLTGGGETYREIVDVDETTEWEYILEDEFVDGVYITTAYITKNGYGSALAEPITFTIGTTGGVTDTGEEEIEVGELSFQLNQVLNSEIVNTYKNNTDLILYTVGIVIIGILLGILIHRFLFVRGEKKLESNFKKMLSGDGKKKDSKDEDDKKETKQESPEDGETTKETGPDGPNADLFEEEFPPFQKDADVDENGDPIEEGAEVNEAQEGEDEGMESAEEEVVEETDDQQEEPTEEELAEEPEDDTEATDEDASEESEDAQGAGEEEEVATEEEAASEDVDPAVAAVVAKGIAEVEKVEKDSKYGSPNAKPKSKRIGVFGFLRRNKTKDEEEGKVSEPEPESDDEPVVDEVEQPEVEESEEVAQEDTAPAEEAPDESSVTKEKAPEELTREEFLEQFKQHDPDPEGEDRKGSMSDKVEEETKKKSKADDDESGEEESSEDNEPDDSIEGMGLSARTTNALKAAGFKKSDELEGLSKNELVNIEGVGLVAADEITDVLRGKKPKKAKSKSKEKPRIKRKRKARKPKKKGTRRRNIKISLTSGD